MFFLNKRSNFEKKNRTNSVIDPIHVNQANWENFVKSITYYFIFFVKEYDNYRVIKITVDSNNAKFESSIKDS